MKLEPGWPKMEPEFTKNGGKIEKNALNRPKWLPDSSQDPFPQWWSPLWEDFWVPWGSPKSSKNRLFQKTDGPRNAFLSIFVANAGFLDFLVDFWSIYHWKSMKKQMCFVATARVFFKLATPTKHRILRYESYFFVSWVFFYTKNGQTLSATLDPEKSSKKCTTWDPKCSQNWKKSSWQTLKISKMAPPQKKIEDRFLTIFSSGQKIKKRWHGYFWVISSPGPWAPVGEYRGNNKSI